MVTLSIEAKGLQSLGFDEGTRGVHTSRTMMLGELEAIMESVPAPRNPQSVRIAILEDNVIGKATRSGRRNTATKLVDLYHFNTDAHLYTAFETLWSQTTHSRPVLALLLAACRDAVLRSTAHVICKAPIDSVVDKESIYETLLEGFPSKYAETTLRSTSCNTMSSWKQSGHLTGRKVAVRSKANSDYWSTTFATYICLLRGLKGQEILKSQWMQLLDFSVAELEASLIEANRHGLLTYRRMGDIVELAPGPQLLEVLS